PARQACRSRAFRPARSGEPQSWYSEVAAQAATATAPFERRQSGRHRTAWQARDNRQASARLRSLRLAQTRRGTSMRYARIDLHPRTNPAQKYEDTRTAGKESQTLQVLERHLFELRPASLAILVLEAF